MIYTVGHSIRTAKEFVTLLKAYGVEVLVDVRRLPGSHRYPQFNQDRLKAFLKKHRIHYQHKPGLGGRRKARPDSENEAWRNLSFRGYADYMETNEFQENLAAIIELSRRKTIALMCAEALPWRCHRSLIADALLAQGLEVEDIFTASRAVPHSLPAWAKIRRRSHQVTYPPE